MERTLSIIKPDAVAKNVVGKILDRFESIHVSPLVRAVKFLIQLSNLSKVIVLIGNHDRQNNSDFLSDFHPFTALEENPNIIIASKVIDLQDRKSVV